MKMKQLTTAFRCIATTMALMSAACGQIPEVPDGGDGSGNGGGSGNEPEETVSVELERDVVTVAKEGGEYAVGIKSGTPCYLVPPSVDEDSEADITRSTGGQSFTGGLYEPEAYSRVKGIQCERSIDNNVLMLNVKPAEFKNSKQLTIPIYDFRGDVAAKLKIIQEGNPDASVEVPKLGQTGKLATVAALEAMRDAVRTETALERKYLEQSPRVPFAADDRSILDCWSSFYNALNLLTAIKQADEQALCCYRPYLDTYIALVYLNLTSHWKGVPFFVEAISTERRLHLARTLEDDMLYALSVMLENVLPELEEKKNDPFTDIDSALFVSKDVARVLLAYVYCLMEDHERALPLLEEVIEGGHYSLSATSDRADFVYDSECILGFAPVPESGEGRHQCLDYKEVLLTAAECRYRLGNIPEAKAYLGRICQAKSLDNIDTSSLPDAIVSVRQALRSLNFLTFLRRNSLGTQVLGLDDGSLYQLLWPIPLEELEANDCMLQTDGYR